MLPVSHSHDLAVLRPGGDFELGRNGLSHDGERVVSGGDERVREPGEHAAVVVADVRRLAVHLLAGARHRRAEGAADGLVAEADAEDRSRGAEPLDHVDRDAGLIGGPWSGRDDNALRRHGSEASTSISSLRTTLSSAPSSPRYWTRL